MKKRTDAALAIMPLCAVLALSGITLLAPRRAALAAPPAPHAAQSAPAMEGDGDGDELLEHWGDPKYTQEERFQMEGVGAAFALLGGVSWRKRTRRDTRATTLTLTDVSPQRKAA